MGQLDTWFSVRAGPRARRADPEGRRTSSSDARGFLADAKLAAGITGRYHAAEATLGTLAARLDALSPLAVLGRGYAVCWNADRTHAIRDATAAAPGDRVRVTLAKGELDCEVR